MKCQQLIDEVKKDLNDPKEVFWTKEDLEAALSDALLALAVVRPDSTATTQLIPLIPGTRQTLPAGGLRLITITRNMGADGLVPGTAIRVGDRDTLDAMYPDWHLEVGSVVFEYTYNPLVPKEFFVYPGMTGANIQQVQATFSRAPAAIVNAETEDLPVDDVYAPALREWMLFRCWSGDDESSPNFTQAQGRKANFFQLLNAKAPADGATSAKAGAAK